MGRVARVALLVLLLVGLSRSHDVIERLVEMSTSEDDIVTSELNTVTEDGKTVLEESATDKDCRAQVMKAKFDDDTVNTIINDLDGDQGLVLFSESPDVCYVRSLNGQQTKCKGGYDTKKKGEPIVSKTTLYKNGPQLKPADLSEPLRKQCENRTIIQLVQETPSDVDDIIRTELTDIENDEGNDAVRTNRAVLRRVKKRSSSSVSCTNSHTDCDICCEGWWMGKECLKCCTYHDSCHPV